MLKPYCDFCKNTRMANEFEPCLECMDSKKPEPQEQELFEVSDNPSYRESTEQIF